jgi:hypothetical protein
MNISAESDSIATPRLLFCTVNGAIGVVAKVNSNAALLLALQERMRNIIKPIGNLPHDEYVLLILSHVGGGRGRVNGRS